MCIMELTSKDLLSKLCLYVYFFSLNSNIFQVAACFLFLIFHIFRFFFFFLKIGSLLGVNHCFILEIGLFL